MLASFEVDAPQLLVELALDTIAAEEATETEAPAGANPPWMSILFGAHALLTPAMCVGLFASGSPQLLTSVWASVATRTQGGTRMAAQSGFGAVCGTRDQPVQ